MSSFRNPVGPQPSRVYWRRRMLVLGAVVVVVAVVLLIVIGRGGGSSSAAPTDSPSATAHAGAKPSASRTAAAATDAPSSSASGGATGSPTDDATASGGSGASSAKDGATCTKSQITLTPITDKTTYGPTEEPKIAMSIRNTGKNACHMDLGSSQQVLTITSGQETYWTSKDCQTGGTNQDVTLKAGQTLTTPSIAWDRTRSSTTTCDASRSSVTAGGASYHLDVSVGNITSSTSAQFVLS
ncbi:hypothetical protein [Curtobacterium sp. RRHDQ10]|uniref:hypothetical protein n=1 Tax=Curtobacterium phyllosphaerae TaxID=3413379 RepID=UPI003BF0231A